MSELLVLAYDHEDTAEKVKDKLEGMERAHLVGLEDLILVVRKEDGKLKIEQSQNLMGEGALGGAFWGMLIGFLFWMPFLGLAIGAISGAIAGKFADIGIDDKFVKEVAETIQPGNSAVFMLIRNATHDKFVKSLTEFKGKVVQTSLTEENEAKLRTALGGQ